MAPPDNASLAELLARIDERTKGIKETVDSFQKKLDEVPENYVSLEAFRPVQRIVYGAVGLILLAVFGALLALVIIKGK